MSEENNVTPTEVEEVESVEEENSVEEKNGGDNKVNYVKLRVDRAKEQTEKNILGELGAESLEDVKSLINTGKEALQRVQELEEKLNAEKQIKEEMMKKNALLKLLDEHNVFDSDALANYVDLDKVKVTNGIVEDGEGIISSLKKVKPKFFETQERQSDTYIKGSSVTQKTALEKQKEGNTIGAIGDYLKQIL